MQYGAVWEQTSMDVTWYNPIFPIWLPSLHTRSRTEEWPPEVVRIGESEKGNPLWDLSTLRFFKRWAAERFFAGEKIVWVETKKDRWKNEFDLYSLERYKL